MKSKGRTNNIYQSKWKKDKQQIFYVKSTLVSFPFLIAHFIKCLCPSIKFEDGRTLWLVSSMLQTIRSLTKRVIWQHHWNPPSELTPEIHFVSCWNWNILLYIDLYIKSEDGLSQHLNIMLTQLIQWSGCSGKLKFPTLVVIKAISESL